MSRTSHPRAPRSMRPRWVLVLASHDRLVPAEEAIPHDAARFYTEAFAFAAAARLNVAIDKAERGS